MTNMTDDVDSPLFTSDKSQIVKIRMGATSPASNTPKTIIEVFDATVAKYGDKPALHQKIVKPGAKAEETSWTDWTWNEYRTHCNGFAKSLISLGFEPFDIVNIIGFNSPEWFFSNYGAILAGGIAAGIYTTNGPDACKYISQHSKAKVVVCDSAAQLEKYCTIAADLPELKAIVMYRTDEVPDDIKDRVTVSVYNFDQFLELGSEITDDELKARAAAQKPGQTCTLIYTSGTTGPPKAVMITHDNITWTSSIMLNTLVPRPLGNGDHLISYLPLSHIAAQILDLHCPMSCGAQVWFAQSDALRGSLTKTLQEVQPTIFFGVPRVWEKIYEKMQEVGMSITGVKKVLSTWAKGKASAYWESHEYGGRKRTPLFYRPACVLLGKVKQSLGFERCVGFYVSAAPIEEKILRYFSSVNIPILEVFGQSECTGPQCVNKYDAFKFGTVGRPMPGTESKLEEGTGEFCYRGRNIFAGYMDMEDKTNETIDPEGWLHSGDVVTFDDCDQKGMPKPSGFVRITGRIKELIITAGGENVAPVLIEENMKEAMPALSNCMVIGDKRKFLSILLCLSVDINSEGVASSKLTVKALDTSKKIGSNATTTEEAMTCPKWKEHLDNGLKAANNKATSRAHNVGKWTILPTDFTEKGGELTPTLKLKRSVTADKYKKEIEAMYA